MIRTEITCDKCGRKIEGQERFFCVTMKERFLKCPGLLYTEKLFEDMTLCAECAEPIQAPESKEEKEAAVMEEKPQKKIAAVKKTEVAPVQQDPAPAKRKKVDPVLVKVLLNKGWSQAKIAKEMDVTPAAINQAVKRIEGKEL